MESTILIVDDEPANLTVLHKLLADRYKIRAANSGQRALDMAGVDPKPELILLDVMMPEMDGYEVIERLKKNPVTRDIPVIFVSALDDVKDEKKGFNLGAVDFVRKPITPEILKIRVKNQLALKMAQNFLIEKNDYLEKEIEKRIADSINVQTASIRALANLAEVRDPETGEHIIRTQKYVEIIARYLQQQNKFADELHEEYITLLIQSAPLHDIGKVGIPDNVLLKPGKLNAQEWEVMKSHAAIGANAIEKSEKDLSHPVRFLQIAKQIARSHHEKWDGSGYPDGLKGDEIPLAARIMTLADVFDALISKRLYKDASSYEDARQEISRQINIQFDPDVAGAFLNCFDSIVEVAKKYPDPQTE